MQTKVQLIMRAHENELTIMTSVVIIFASWLPDQFD